MSQEEQLPILESEPELNRSKQAGASSLGREFEVGGLFKNNLARSQSVSRRTTTCRTLRYNPEFFLEIYSKDSPVSSPPTGSLFAGCEDGVRSGSREYLPSEVR